MDTLFQDDFGFLITTTVAFRPGSIVNDVIFMFDEESAVSETDITVAFNGKLDSEGQFESSGLFYQGGSSTTAQGKGI